MNTMKMTRTIRRELPNGWLVWVGTDGIRVRPKRTAAVFNLTWKEVIERMQLLAVNGRGWSY